ncbi:MAG: hypothetical protein J6K80_09200 [Oscillospiraceae bacterium]|nr:hypothetical protein [Oscillospiraceae bacterium]
MGDGWHILVCADVKCGAQIGDPKKHEWTFDVANGDTYHTCKDCKLEEKHNMLEVEGSNTAGCTTAGERTVECSVCSKIRVEDAAANGHTLGGTWYKDKDGHYQQCKLEDCKAVIEESKGNHNYQYNSSAGWFECNDCGAIHDEFMGDPCDNELTVVSQSCKEIKYHCNECGYDMTKTGTFDYHSFEAGYCVHCGKADGSAGGDSESGSDSESGGDSNSGSDSESGGDSNSGSDSESGGDSNSGSDSESGGDSNSSSDSEVGGDSGSSSDSEAGVDSGSSSNSEPVGEPSSETGSGSDGENIEIT